MSSGDVLNIDPETLAAAATKARLTATASVPNAVVLPPATAVSDFDAACEAVANAAKGLLDQVSASDRAAAEKQATMLSVSPPAIVQQDIEAVDTYLAPVIPLRQFPMPTANPEAPATKTWTI